MKAGVDQKLTLMSIRIRRRFAIALAMTLALSLGAALERWVLMSGVPPDAMEEFQLMSQAWRAIDRFYVDRSAIRPAAMTYAAINAMTESLGDTGHSVFLTPQQAKRADSAVQGRLTAGLGIEIQSVDHRTVVVAPIDGSPAQLAGVRAGDVIMEVNGHSIAGLSFPQITGRIAGQAGEPVELTVLNPRDGRRREIKIVRAAMKINNVSWLRLPGTALAHVRIAMFSEGESGDLRKALGEIEQQHLQGIILDLRNNPGGVLDEAVGTTSQFLKSGNVLWEKDAKGAMTAVGVQPGGLAPEIPLAVLINGGSASDSEIVAGALRDANRATLIGEKTFGTGTVLTQIQLSDGSSLLLAVQEWLTPDKDSFWHRGIEPEVKVALAPDATPLLPSAEREMTEEQLHSSRDAQLLKAIEILSMQGKTRS
jgi:carboxyl-terminal processing protease